MRTNPSGKSGSTRVDIIIIVFAVVIIGQLLAVAIRKYVKRPFTPASNSCIANLKQMDGAKQQWAVEFKKLPTDVPADSDIYGPTLYIRAKPLCPQGGSYSLNAASAAPTRSKSGAPDFHTL